MAELTRTHISDAITSGAPLATLYDPQRQHFPNFMKQFRTRAETDRISQSVSLSQSKEETLDSKHQKFSPSYDSYSESSRYKNHDRSGSSDKGRSQKTPTSPLSPSSQKLLQFDLPGTSLERSKSSTIIPPTTTGFKPTTSFTDVNKTEMASIPGSRRFSPAGLQHRMAAELSYLNAIEESVRQLSDVERVRGISLAQQESVSLAQIIKVLEFSSVSFCGFSSFLCYLNYSS
uniref:Centrosome-associated protein 350-like n=1 Tax=Castor canadensis TaxID=51338 RepID=A0A8B7UKR6_CASCN|nr:centrosome-associated protein 350-like [Castor canadensis]